MKNTSAINLDHVQTVARSRLERFIGRLDEARMDEVCRAMEIALGCR